MFADLLRGLLAPAPQRLPEPDARLALAALLVRIARSDGDYAEEEIAQIDCILSCHHGLSPFEAGKLRQQAEALEAEAPDTVRFTRALKDAVPYEDRIDMIEAMWAVVLADGKRDQEEDSLLRLVANLLGVNDRDSNIARLKVEQGKA
ncbi:tellurite resistance TerB family protein [Acidimangrovimonas pyrenivorans]|uniref:TerB family tellurite resistance protein n=1 Tax=Acidimangrovimonas pyrenivorans TaxID=2030798 RepID=A0ABV7AC60_9RHOB